ncbi:MAG: TrkA family potassium uptake protein [Leptospiraceae bacterium]|nr:TrkA family potassium uptake protein [Leptospiraceae bacterium]
MFGNQQKRRFIVIGLGNFGMSVARTLHNDGHEVIAIDRREELVDRNAGEVTRAVVADGTQKEQLAEAGAENADCGIVSTGDDLTASILSSLALHDLGVKEIYAKVISMEHHRVMVRLGIQETIFPELESGRNLARRLIGKGLLNYLNIAPGSSIREMIVPPKWQGQSLKELRLSRTHGLVVIGVHDQLRDKMNIPPDPDRKLLVSDTLLVAGHDAAFLKL